MTNSKLNSKSHLCHKSVHSKRTSANTCKAADSTSLLPSKFMSPFLKTKRPITWENLLKPSLLTLLPTEAQSLTRKLNLFVTSRKRTELVSLWLSSLTLWFKTRPLSQSRPFTISVTPFKSSRKSTATYSWWPKSTAKISALISKSIWSARTSEVFLLNNKTRNLQNFAKPSKQNSDPNHTKLSPSYRQMKTFVKKRSTSNCRRKSQTEFWKKWSILWSPTLITNFHLSCLSCLTSTKSHRPSWNLKTLPFLLSFIAMMLRNFWKL